MHVSSLLPCLPTSSSQRLHDSLKATSQKEMSCLHCRLRVFSLVSYYFRLRGGWLFHPWELLPCFLCFCFRPAVTLCSSALSDGNDTHLALHQPSLELQVQYPVLFLQLSQATPSQTCHHLLRPATTFQRRHSRLPSTLCHHAPKLPCREARGSPDF